VVSAARALLRRCSLCTLIGSALRVRLVLARWRVVDASLSLLCCHAGGRSFGRAAADVAPSADALFPIPLCCSFLHLPSRLVAAVLDLFHEGLEFAPRIRTLSALVRSGVGIPSELPFVLSSKW
jgi:hypothetical protein